MSTAAINSIIAPIPKVEAQGRVFIGAITEYLENRYTDHLPIEKKENTNVQFRFFGLQIVVRVEIVMAHPLHGGRVVAYWKNPEEEKLEPLHAYAFDLQGNVFCGPDVTTSLAELPGDAAPKFVKEILVQLRDKQIPLTP